MALRTRIIIGLATIVALLMIAVLPPRSCGDSGGDSLLGAIVCGQWSQYGVSSHQDALRRAEVSIARRLRRLALADSLRQQQRTSRSVRSPDGSITVVYEEPVTADSARVWLRLALAERDRIPGRAIGMPVVVVLQTAAWRLMLEKMLEFNVWRAGGRTSNQFISTTAGDTSCFVDLRLYRDGRDARHAVATDSAGPHGLFLGLCALAARYGAPGERVQQILVRVLSESRGYYNRSQLQSSVVPDLRDAARRDVPSPYMYRTAACMRDERTCGALIGLRAGRDLVVLEYEQALMLRDFLVYRIAADPEGFGRFWRSDAAFGDALSAGSNGSAENMIQAWARQRFAFQESGPQADAKTTLAAISWAGLAILAATLVGMRRRVTS